MAKKQPVEAMQPEVRSGRRVSVVWIVPVVALLLGAWLVYRHFAEQGPLVKVGFRTADGIVKGKTEVRCRSVRVGVVEGVKLTEDLGAVQVFLRMEPEAEGLLREESRFWVVRPRVSGGAISGLGTIISGAYIELEPGTGPVLGNDAAFEGLEEPPVTAAGVPGLRLTLLAERGDRADVGAPVLFRGNEVGRIDRSVFDPELRKTKLQAFIDQRYVSLVTENTRFWIDNVVEVETGAQGVKLKIPSLASLVAGGVTFGVPEGGEPGAALKNGDTFVLYDDEGAAAESTFGAGAGGGGDGGVPGPAGRPGGVNLVRACRRPGREEGAGRGGTRQAAPGKPVPAGVARRWRGRVDASDQERAARVVAIGEFVDRPVVRRSRLF
jgi:paraquat-inducible protein B